MSHVFAHGQLRLYLLSLLDEAPRHGYEVIRDLERRFDGMYSPSAGTIYPRLARLEEEGLVVREDKGRKAVYRITPAGRAELAERQAEAHDLQVDLDRTVRRLAEQVRSQVRDRASDLRAELSSAARTARKNAHDNPPAAPLHTGDPPEHEQSDGMEAAIEELRRGLRAATRKQWIDPDAAGEIVSIIEHARDDVLKVMRRAMAARRKS